MERQRWVDRKPFCREVTVMTETNSRGDGQPQTSTLGAAHHVAPAGDRPSRPMYAGDPMPSSAADDKPCVQLTPDPYSAMPEPPVRRSLPKTA